MLFQAPVLDVGPTLTHLRLSFAVHIRVPMYQKRVNRGFGTILPGKLWNASIAKASFGYHW